MSFTIVAALSGEEACKAPFPQGLHASSVHRLLGQGAYLFRFLVDSEHVTAGQLFTGDVKVFFLKEPVSFNIYVHEEVSHRMWLIDTLPADVISQLGVLNPMDMINHVKHGKVGLHARAVWTTNLKPQLEQHLLNRTGENNIFKKLVALIEHDVMSVRQVARRNVLHEMTNTLRADIFLSIDAENYLNLRLRAPTDEVIYPRLTPCDELNELILSTPMQ